VASAGNERDARELSMVEDVENLEEEQDIIFNNNDYLVFDANDGHRNELLGENRGGDDDDDENRGGDDDDEADENFYENANSSNNVNDIRNFFIPVVADNNFDDSEEAVQLFDANYRRNSLIGSLADLKAQVSIQTQVLKDSQVQSKKRKLTANKRAERELINDESEEEDGADLLNFEDSIFGLTLNNNDDESEEDYVPDFECYNNELDDEEMDDDDGCRFRARGLSSRENFTSMEEDAATTNPMNDLQQYWDSKKLYSSWCKLKSGHYANINFFWTLRLKSDRYLDGNVLLASTVARKPAEITGKRFDYVKFVETQGNNMDSMYNFVSFSEIHSTRILTIPCVDIDTNKPLTYRRKKVSQNSSEKIDSELRSMFADKERRPPTHLMMIELEPHRLHL
jgi:hypothetical protein